MRRQLVAPRVEMSGSQRITYTQAWDAENRLKVVTNTLTSQVARFTYDGDGARALQVNLSGTTVYTTAYAGATEVLLTGTQRITKTYYSAGAQLIAMRVVTSTGGNLVIVALCLVRFNHGWLPSCQAYASERRVSRHCIRVG